MISIIFPVKNEEGNVEELHRRTKAALDDIHEPYEIIFVDDGSTDGTLKKLHTLSPITIIEFARRWSSSTFPSSFFTGKIMEIIIRTS